jgi:hypothetical protein
MIYHLTQAMLEVTFEHFRQCGRGRDECQALWISSWDSPEIISRVIHSKHTSQEGGYEVDDVWLNELWLELGNTNSGIRVQIHTHLREAFHSPSDDAYPIIHKPGFLSLVIPNFALGPVSFEDAYLTEIQPNGDWRQVAIESRLVVT